MTRIQIKRQEMAVQELLSAMNALQLDPGYQREGGIWTRDRQQLFIDSILNGFDVPPIYLHRLRPPTFDNGVAATYAVVDGRQRLEALRLFADSELALAKDFVLLEETDESQPGFELQLEVQAARYGGTYFEDLRGRAPELGYRFLDFRVPVSIIESEDVDVIEELFFRLNEGVPLTAAEKRARGALLREAIDPLVNEDELFRSARFRRARRVHEDLFIRLLFVVQRSTELEDVPDLKRRALDDFAASFRPALGEVWDDAKSASVRGELQALIDDTVPVLAAMNSVFEPADRLLSTVSSFMVYFLVFRQLLLDNQALPSRADLEDFQTLLRSLQGAEEEQLSEGQEEVLEYAQPIQGTTTGSYFVRRARIIYRFVTGALTV